MVADKKARLFHYAVVKYKDTEFLLILVLTTELLFHIYWIFQKKL